MLDGQRVLIVGGSSGIGLAAAAAHAGAVVTITSRSRATLDAALTTLDGTDTAVVFDTGDD